MCDTADYNLLDPEHGGAVVSVTDELAQHPAERLIDGYKLDGGEWWTHEPRAFPQAVVFELAQGAPYVIDRAVLNAWTSEWRYAWMKDFRSFLHPRLAPIRIKWHFWVRTDWST